MFRVSLFVLLALLATPAMADDVCNMEEAQRTVERTEYVTQCYRAGQFYCATMHLCTLKNGSADKCYLVKSEGADVSPCLIYSARNR